MSTSIRQMQFIRCIALALMSVLLSPTSTAQQQTASLKQQIVGTWIAVSQYVDQDNKKASLEFRVGNLTSC